MPFGRKYELQVEGLRLTGLRCKFEILRNTANVPNKATIEITNLAPDTRRTISDSPAARVVLLAGYKDTSPSAIFVGSLKHTEHVQSGPDWHTKISSNDGVPRSARISKAFGAGANFGAVLRDLVSATGMGPGNSERIAKRLQGRSTGASGYTVAGAADVALTNLLDELGLEWSVQDSAIQILERGAARQTRAVFLSPNTGLIGSPEVTTSKKIKAQSLILPGVTPGLLVQVQSKRVNGFFKVRAAKYVGDTHGSGADWRIEFDGEPVES